MWLRTHCEQDSSSLKDAKDRLHDDIKALCGVWPKTTLAAQLDPSVLRTLMINEGSKSFTHKNVDADNEAQTLQTV
ncbi:MAG: hypothetical protein IPJ10_15015 [Flavobacteriales bacterium]|nr:hypothetical protein [Flavobacteriales bacterium]